MFDDHNYFSLFDLPVKIPVDVVALNRQYQILQRQYHPDNYATASDSKKAQALQKSAEINSAYRILKNPVSAAQYRVSLEGIDIDAEHNTIGHSLFLSEQFELREKLDDIENSHDDMALTQLYDDVISRKRHVYTMLLSVIDQNDWQSAKEPLYQLRYFNRLIEQIELLQEKEFAL